MVTAMRVPAIPATIPSAQLLSTLLFLVFASKKYTIPVTYLHCGAFEHSQNLSFKEQPFELERMSNFENRINFNILVTFRVTVKILNTPSTLLQIIINSI